ncbi:DUF3560 domain-containing protein [Leisingera caerulea]|uniref:DUF3560 domain-containing protein n=1 Tax=Leisingera caerulea TaxID=506591 RepID=UPI003F4A9B47
MNRYEEKQEARRARLEAAADRAEGRAEATYNRADLREEVSGIPLGQPILVGHHSERKHRRAIERAHRAMDASIAEGKRAADLRARAAAVGTGGISADDPEAVRKLKEKLAGLEVDQGFMREANKLARKALKAGGLECETAVQEFAAGIAKLRPAWNANAARRLLEPDFAGRTGFADYELKNNGAEIRRLKQRIEQLAKASQAETKRHVFQGLCEVVENTEENRLQSFFDGKPPAATRQILKDHGFRWAPSLKAWQRKLTNSARFNARLALKALGVDF